MKALLFSCLSLFLLTSCGTISEPWYEANFCNVALADGSPKAFTRIFGSPNSSNNTQMLWSYEKDRTVIRQTPIDVRSRTTLHNTGSEYVQPYALTTTSVTGGQIYSTDVKDGYVLLVNVRNGKTTDYKYAQTGYGAIPIKDQSLYGLVDLIHACRYEGVDKVRKLWEKSKARGFGNHVHAVRCAISAAAYNQKETVLYFMKEHGVLPDEKVRLWSVNESELRIFNDQVKGKSGQISAHANLRSVREAAQRNNAQSVLAILP